MNEKLSVIVPIYNVEQYLEQCINSILNQSYFDLDIILVDDGSTDNSNQIADKFALDSRVKVIHKENEGPIKARLAGIKIAQGKFVTFVDSDDWIDVNMYSEMMKHIYEDDLDMVCCGINRFFDDDEIYESIPILQEGLYNKEGIIEKIYPRLFWDYKKGKCCIDESLCSKIIKKDILESCLEKAANLDIHLGEDAAVFFPAMMKVNRFYMLHDMFYYHRQRQKNVVASYIKDNEFFEKLFVLYQYLERNFKENNYYDTLHNQLERFIMKFISLRLQYLESTKELYEAVFPFEEIKVGERVVIYGAGNVGQIYIKQNEKYHFCKLILWVDKNFKQYDKKLNVDDPKKIESVEYDYIIIAVQMPVLAREIREELLSYGVPVQKIVWKVKKSQSFID